MESSTSHNSRSRFFSLFFGHLVVMSILAGIFGFLYFDDHAWGAWGDDSAGYILLAGKMYAHQPLIYKDELAAKGLAFFGDEKLARWLTPTHHQFINPSGTIASKYPVGVSLLMVAAARLLNSADAFYLMNPFLATLNIALLYLLAIVVFPKKPYRSIVGVLAASSMGIANLYYDHAIAQPMREIPSITFLLISAILLFLSVRQLRARTRLPILFLAGVSFGVAFTIRETSVVILPAFALYGFASLWNVRYSFVKNTKSLLLPSAVFCIALVVGSIPAIQNSIAISQEKVPFKQRDTGSVVLLPNMGHIQTISLQNIFDNPGKFRPGKGSLPHYWSILQGLSPVPFFLAFALLGSLLLWKEDRKKALFFLLWFLGILGIFSLWINPYSRYILPLLPPLMIVGSYGAVAFFTTLLPAFFRQRSLQIGVGAVALLTMGVLYAPLVTQAKDNLQQDVYRFKAISESDLRQLTQLGKDLQQKGDKPVLMFSGAWQYGTSETLEAHTGLKTVRFPLEQRFIFPEQQVEEFFDQIFTDGYDIFVWIDATSSAEAVQWLNRYSAKQVQSIDLTFQPDVTIYHISHDRDTQSE